VNPVGPSQLALGLAQRAVSTKQPIAGCQQIVQLLQSGIVVWREPNLVLTQLGVAGDAQRVDAVIPDGRPRSMPTKNR